MCPAHLKGDQTWVEGTPGTTLGESYGVNRSSVRQPWHLWSMFTAWLPRFIERILVHFFHPALTFFVVAHRAVVGAGRRGVATKLIA